MSTRLCKSPYRISFHCQLSGDIPDVIRVFLQLSHLL